MGELDEERAVAESPLKENEIRGTCLVGDIVLNKKWGSSWGGDPLPAASLEVQPSDSLRGPRIDIFDEQYLVALLIVNEIVHLLFR